MNKYINQLMVKLALKETLHKTKFNKEQLNKYDNAWMSLSDVEKEKINELVERNE